MEFDYKSLGENLAWNRSQKNLRQTDIEELSKGILKQSAISAAEHGETRLAVDTLIAYCNVLGIRTDTILSPYLKTAPEDENSGAIIDPYVTKLAEIMKGCNPAAKQAILEIALIIKKLRDSE